MKTLLSLAICLTAACAYAGEKPKPKETSKPSTESKIYTAVGSTVYKVVGKDGTVYYAFTCVNIKGEVITVGVKQEYIKSIKLDEDKVEISY